MTLFEIFNQKSLVDLAQKAPVFWLKGGDVCPLFCSLFFRRIAELIELPLISFDCAASSQSELSASCSVSFLGQSSLYWIKDLGEWPVQQRRAALEYIARYQGPHKLCCVSEQLPSEVLDEASTSAILVVDLEDKITAKSYGALYSFIYKRPFTDEQFCQKLYQYVKQLSLDNACMLAGYQEVLGRRYESFLDFWLERLWMPSQSLFTLSQFFFAHDITQFLTVWDRVSQLYPEEYWIAYWSEQLWQALLFLDRVHQEGSKGFQKPFGRLPFSFLQRDWRSHSRQELVQAHAFLCDLDYHFKNGTSFGGIDMFCIKFVAGRFKQTDGRQAMSLS